MWFLIIIGVIIFLIAIGSIAAENSRKKNAPKQKKDDDVVQRVLDRHNVEKVKTDIDKVVNEYFESGGTRNLSINVDTGRVPEDVRNFEFVALDFETANNKRESAISLGLVLFQGNQVVGMKRYVFKNADNGDIIYTHIHGMTAEDILHSPYFDVYWTEIKELIVGKTIVGHNVLFDLQVLSSLTTHFRLDPVHFRYICTMDVYKKTMVDYRGRHTLEVLCSEHKIPYWHHNAVYDAISAGMLFLVVAEWAFYSGKLSKHLEGKEYVLATTAPRFTKRTTTDKIPQHRTTSLSDVADLIEEDLIDKHIVVTGKFPYLDREQAEDHVHDLGAILRSGVTGKTFMVVTGLDPGPAKIDKIEQVNQKRAQKGEQPIMVTNEVGFIELLKKFNRF